MWGRLSLYPPALTQVLVKGCPCNSAVDKPGIQAGRLLCFHKPCTNSRDAQHFSICIIDFPSTLAFNNVFVIKLVKVWPGATLDVVLGTLKEGRSYKVL